jgi:hypothetical protein
LAKVVCPHGLTAVVPFDALGYLKQPSDRACEEHLQAKAELDAELVALRRPGWFTIWRETRKARRALRDL